MNKKGKHAWVSTHACRRVYPKMVSEFCLSLNCTVFPNNGLFPSCPKLCFKARLSRRPLIWKWIFMAHTNKTQFHKKGSALSLVLKVRVFGTWKENILMFIQKLVSLGTKSTISWTDCQITPIQCFTPQESIK